MIAKVSHRAAALVTLSLGLAGATLADDFTIDWRTVDGGGATWSIGGEFELGGTIGQADAAALAMTGGDYSLTGGFWAAPPCWCVSDVNHDGRRDSLDIQQFIMCMVSGGGDCACADLDINGALESADVGLFVTGLLLQAACP